MPNKSFRIMLKKTVTHFLTWLRVISGRLRLDVFVEKGFHLGTLNVCYLICFSPVLYEIFSGTKSDIWSVMYAVPFCHSVFLCFSTQRFARWGSHSEESLIPSPRKRKKEVKKYYIIIAFFYCVIFPERLKRDQSRSLFWLILHIRQNPRLNLSGFFHCSHFPLLSRTRLHGKKKYLKSHFECTQTVIILSHIPS